MAPGWRISRDFLNDGQKQAVRHVLESTDRVIGIRGVAGSGKTTLMQESVEALTGAGRHVLALAPTAQASRGVLRAEGMENADTVARFLVDERLREQARGGVIWIDEAGLLGLPTLRRVFDLARGLDARVVLVGDSRQHSPVERGDALRLLEERAGLRPAEVTEILRQKSPDLKKAVDDLAHGRVNDGFARLDQLGAIHEEHGEGRYERLASEYADALSAGKSVLAVAPSHKEGRAVTAAIRTALQERHVLGAEHERCAVLLNLHLTDAEKADADNYQPEQVLQFHRNAPGIKSGERMTVQAVDGEGITAQSADGTTHRVGFNQAVAFQLFQPDQIELAAGDVIRITRNGRTLDDERLNNGDLLGIGGFTETGDLITSKGVIPRGFGNLTYGYCSTSHASQGKTVDQVFIAQSECSKSASSAEQFYVSASRARHSVRVFTDDKEALARMIERTHARRFALDLSRDYERKGWHLSSHDAPGIEGVDKPAS